MGIVLAVLAGLASGTCAVAQVPEHAALVWTPGENICLQCHEEEALQVHASVHYQWQGPAAAMVNGAVEQGKAAGAMNAYCINITGNWNGCSACHVGLGAKIEPTATWEQLSNIDCLICHQRGYKRVKVNGVMVPDTGKMAISMDEAIRTVHRPDRATCLQCHAKGGGGDNFKRGDLALAHTATQDRAFDVHMATTGANLNCTDCHKTTEHRIAGRGSDLRPTDLEASVACSACHGSSGPHSAGSELGRHTARVACQTCHIRMYARNATDTPASEATEVHRNWAQPVWNDALQKYEPAITLANNRKPAYLFWNGDSWGYNLNDTAAYDAKTGSYHVSLPVGGINDPASKLFPFKYKTASQPLATQQKKLIALDTSVYFKTGNFDAAVTSGLVNMGLSSSVPYKNVKTDEYQALNHEVQPKSQALTCKTCHGTTTQLNLAALGYGLKAGANVVCVQCHELEDDSLSFKDLHAKHVRDKRYDCSWCHGFSRPEKKLIMPRR